MLRDEVNDFHLQSSLYILKCVLCRAFDAFSRQNKSSSYYTDGALKTEWFLPA
jgi:hypothetical protein